MRKFSIFLTLAIIVLASFYTTKVSFAQLEQSDISVTTDPDVPGPFETVTATLESYTYDLDQAKITWKIDGKIQLTGTGEKRFVYQTKGVGEVSVVEVTVEIGTEKIVKRISTKPGTIDLLWQAADSYVPPFYKGKALPSSEGMVKVVAEPAFMVGGKNADAKNIVYNWRRNYNALPQVSGYGKQSLTIKMNYLNSQENINLTTTDPRDNSTASKDISLAPFTPKIIFYEKDPVLGTRYNQGINSEFSVTATDKTIVAEPYFVSPAYPLSGDLEYNWSINNESVPTPDRKNSIILRRGEETGDATLKVSIQSLSKLFLDMSKTILIHLQ